MNATASRIRHRVLVRQQGYALVLVLLLIGVALSTVLFSYITPFAQTINSDKITAAALAQAKDALIGRAAADDNRPGSLPCPDTNNDGQAELFSGNNCPSYVGRLPWKTLGLPDLRDGSGERLWYALSSSFRDHPSAEPINSDTPGIFAVNTGGGIVNNVIAIVFAPGPALDTQLRDAATQNFVQNYLDGENNDGNAVFTSTTANAAFNDRLLLITSDNFFPAVEYRVGREIRANLAAYYTANNYYPFASNYGDATFSCVPGLTQGRLPKPGIAADYSISAGCGGLADWNGLEQPASWFTANNWHLLTYYTVAPACTNATPGCAGVGFITVNNMAIPNNDKRAVIVVAGRAVGVQSRPCTGVADCLESPENTNLDDVYVKNPMSPAFNDKFVVVAP